MGPFPLPLAGGQDGGAEKGVRGGYSEAAKVV